MFIFDIYSGYAIRLKKNNSIKYIYTYWLSPLNLSTTIDINERERERALQIFFQLNRFSRVEKSLFYKCFIEVQNHIFIPIENDN